MASNTRLACGMVKRSGSSPTAMFDHQSFPRSRSTASTTIRVVEPQGRERVDRLPPRARLVRPEHRRIDEGKVGDRGDPPTRVALRITVRLQLLEIHGADPGLLGELALGGLLGSFARAHEATGKHPRPRKRRLGALHEQDVEPS